MEALKLSVEQQNKLLQMLEKLFPEYYKEVIYKGNPDYPASKSARPNFSISLTYDGFVTVPYFEKNDKEPLIYNVQFNYIHWFEFCFTWLQEELYNRLSNIKPIGIDTWNNKLIGKLHFYMTSGNNHPIDYLYSEFKKLK